MQFFYRISHCFPISHFLRYWKPNWLSSQLGNLTSQCRAKCFRMIPFHTTPPSNHCLFCTDLTENTCRLCSTIHYCLRQWSFNVSGSLDQQKTTGIENKYNFRQGEMNNFTWKSCEKLIRLFMWKYKFNSFCCVRMKIVWMRHTLQNALSCWFRLFLVCGVETRRRTFS